MNKFYAEETDIFTMPAIYCYTYADNTYSKARIVYIRYGIFYISKNHTELKICKNACGNSTYSDTDYACSVFLDHRKQPELQWLQNPNELNGDNLNNVKCACTFP
jgi:hypothetical protein